MNQIPQENPAAGEAPAPRRSDKVATYIGRAGSCCVGAALLIAAIALKVWRTTGLKTWMTFGAIIGLCLGYGLGGDIWGARLFDLFTGHNTRKLAEKDGKPVSSLMQKATLCILIGILMFLVMLFAFMLFSMRRTTP